jgi:hypothetical protein
MSLEMLRSMLYLPLQSAAYWATDADSGYSRSLAAHAENSEIKLEDE